MKRTILLGIVLLLLTSLALADSPYDNDNPYNASRIFHLDETSGTVLVDSLGNENGSISNVDATNWVDGKYSNAISLNGADEEIDTGYGNGDLGVCEPWSVSFWVNTTDSIDSMFGTNGAGADINFYNQLRVEYGDFSGNGLDITFDGRSIATGKWIHVALVHQAGCSGSDLLDLYVNGTVLNKTVNKNQVLTNNTFTTDWTFGGRSGTAFHDGGYDDIIIFPREVLSQTEITNLANGNFDENFSVTTTDRYDSTTLVNYTVHIEGTRYITTTGSITTNISTNITKLFNITVESNQSGGYFNRTYLNYNVSTNLAASIFQAELTIHPLESLSGNNITGGTLSAPLQTVNNSQALFLRAGTYNITFTHANYSTTTKEFTVTALTNTSGNITVGSATLNITAINLADGTSILNFTITATIMNGTSNFTTTQFTSDGNLSLGLDTNFTYNITIDTTGFNRQSVLIFMQNASQAYQFGLYVRNSFNLTFVNEITNASITDNITVHFISNTSTTNYTAVNGELFVSLLIPENYTIRYTHQKYGRLREYYVGLTNASHLDLTLYMIEDTNSSGITATLFEKTTLNKLEGAIVYLQRFFPDSNDYRTVAMYTSDTAGKVYFDVEADKEKYKFLVDSPWLTRRLTTDSLFLSDNNYNLFVPFDQSIADNFFNRNGIGYGITFSDSNNAFTVTWTDSQLVATEYCAYLKTYGQYSRNTLNSSCSTSNTGSIELTGVTNNTLNYMVFTANIDGTETAIASASEEIVTDNLESGAFGVFMVAIIFMIFALLSFMPTYSLFMGSAALIFGKLLGLIQLEWYWVIGILIGSAILSLVIHSKK